MYPSVTVVSVTPGSVVEAALAGATASAPAAARAIAAAVERHNPLLIATLAPPLLAFTVSSFPVVHADRASAEGPELLTDRARIVRGREGVVVEHGHHELRDQPSVPLR